MSISEKIKRSMVTITEERYRFQVAEIERLRKENAELKELLQATVDYTGAAASSPNLKFYPSPKWHLVTNGEIQEITIGKTTGEEVMDIVERLRLGDFSPFSGEYIKDADKDEAADEIERLRKDKAELLEEIKKLKEAKEINKYNSYPDDGFGGYPSVYNRR